MDVIGNAPHHHERHMEFLALTVQNSVQHTFYLRRNKWLSPFSRPYKMVEKSPICHDELPNWVCMFHPPPHAAESIRLLNRDRPCGTETGSIGRPLQAPKGRPPFSGQTPGN